MMIRSENLIPIGDIGNVKRFVLILIAGTESPRDKYVINTFSANIYKTFRFSSQEGKFSKTFANDAQR